MDVTFAGHVTCVIAVEEGSQVGQARREALLLGRQAGFDEIDAGRVALVATEMATNILRHGQGGRLLLSLVGGCDAWGVELVAIDRGPGFSLSTCIEDGYSTAGSAGQGLGAIARQARVMELWCDAKGSVLLARVYPQRAAREVDVAYGAVRLPIAYEQRCGDAWSLRLQDGRATLVLVDGLGHGGQAADAAEAGIEAAATCGGGAALDVLAAMHLAMAGSRGGAVGIACVDMHTGKGEFAGVGNIAASLRSGVDARGLASMPGIVGGQYRKAQAFDLHGAAGTLLILHSDGIQGRWNLRDYPSLQHRHPALVVAVLQRDFNRGRDDACILALRLGDRR